MSQPPAAVGLPSQVIGAARRFAKDTYWTLRGAWLPAARPPVPPRHVLFVCHGNICRSPYAAVLASVLASRSAAPSIAWSSAGFAAAPGAPSPPEALAAARRDGVALDAHRAIRLDAALVAAADLIVVFEVAHLIRLQAEYPAAATRFVLLPLLPARRARAFGYARYNIADPFGQPGPVFDACYARIRRDLAAFVAGLEATDS